jgi:hypothetical protein
MLPSDQLQEFFTQSGILAEPAENARGYCVAVHLFDATHLQAQVPGFHHNRDTSGPKYMIDRFRDLAREPLLKLKAVCEHVHQPW